MHTTITYGFMQQMLAASKSYCVLILRAGPKWNQTGIDKIIWEHGRRNFQLRANGTLSIVCPVLDGCDIKGIGISTANAEDASWMKTQGCGQASFCMKRTSVAASPEIPW